MPRIILAEWNTHRAFSRNAASTRAIPTEKLIEQVVEDPFIPLVWGSAQKGMQGGPEVANTDSCEKEWLLARDSAVEHSLRLLALGLHKQVVGRILEPWMWTIVCVSATEWDNFLELRDHPDAEPHIQMLAKEIRKCLDDETTIQPLKPGEWHLPFYHEDDPADISLEDRIKLSVSRCASTSYKTVDGFDMTLERAISLHDKLVGSQPFHASPCEHICQADMATKPRGEWEYSEQHRNFVGFRQYRAMLESA
jgi:hypothetical protein